VGVACRCKCHRMLRVLSDLEKPTV
jgi:hypothetical protein